MTVSNLVNRVSYAGNGSTTNFSYGFKIFADSELEVTLRTNSTGAEATQSLGSAYTVNGAGNTAGGSIDMASAPASGTTLVIVRRLALNQLTDYSRNDSFPAETHEAALDKLCMQVQQLDEELDRSLVLPVSSSLTGLSLPEPSASKLLAWNSDADALENTTGKVNSVSLSVSTLSAGASGTGSVTYTDSTGALALSIGIPTGPQGATGPAGQSVTSVTVSAVGAGGSPTVSYNSGTGALALGVVTGDTGAQGVSVSSVTVSQVAEGGSPTASFNTSTGALALGIPVGATGAQGPTGPVSVGLLLAMT